VTIPDKYTLTDKIQDINALINHSWTGEEIEAKLERKKELRRLFDPAERERISKQIALARENGHDKFADELQGELDSLASSRLAFRTSLNARKGDGAGGPGRSPNQQDRLAQRNLENRRKNAEEVRRAQIKERQAAREKERQAAAAAAGLSPEQEQLEKDRIAAEKMLPQLMKLQQERYKTSNGLPTVHRPLADDDIIGALDLDIDVEI
jgi:RNA polymerase-associated protein RTF1